jgi:pheromone shutdown protein TraB
MTFGAKLSLGVGIAAFGGAIAIVLAGGERLLAVILVLIGAGAMSGFLKARGEQPKADDDKP